ncbi:competence protein CoiA family protein [Synechocystis sp. PCC 6714]|uniref:competence protein CoiA family protein n=2 Tax=unclassified Synechocystis TaxID=2640012 RepID=UPI0004234800|nr:competence protein CoiA family protein [Synechocystis sp. PCC 6714]AIE73835.1 putative exported protein [Synechocystis sp. PCC 6714]
MIKYKFAFNSLQEIIDVNKITKEEQNKHEKFTCISCGHEMITVLGSKRAKHFRHKVIQEIECSPESYLHKLAKFKFYETYQNCLKTGKQFLIRLTMRKICDFYKNEFLEDCLYEGETLNEFDITKYFKNIQIEERIEKFIPDILLTANNGEKIFFEVYATHSCEEKKLTSKYKIIEFAIKNEDDIKIIDSCELGECEDVKFYNFKKDKYDGYCNGVCKYGIMPYAKSDVRYTLFVVRKNGASAILQHKKLEEVVNIGYVIYKEMLKNYDYYTSGYLMSQLYKAKVIEAYYKKIKIKNCYLCRYHAQGWEQAIYCKFLRKNGSSNMATNCEYYRSDEKVFTQYLETEPNENLE